LFFRKHQDQKTRLELRVSLQNSASKIEAVTSNPHSIFRKNPRKIYLGNCNLILLSQEDEGKAEEFASSLKPIADAEAAISFGGSTRVWTDPLTIAISYDAHRERIGVI
jgi:hypothetical protein